MDATVREVADQHRYVIELDGAQVALLDYQLDDAQIALLHAETDPAHTGNGFAGQLTRRALDDARERGLAVLPLCPYVSGWIAKHPDYVDLVPSEQRQHFGLPAGA